ncbi:hypothetical protein TrCOL_g4531 [Triparma columacea]|uniref:PPM-type phosphatase domain-containing protein n=1 Tax=Triparma columacea TaxID=722753 RepID=A0A9W7GEB2_9STRA|nr:hypothetical protein TrCOL_g4531 [Triparma columacea]
MGTLLDKPVTEKQDSEEGSGHGLKFGVSSMQGWRIDMEDSHRMAIDLDSALHGHSLFAVFDGHGGAFAAKFAGENIVPILKTIPQYLQYVKVEEGKRGDKENVELLEDALKACFIEIDEEMKKTPEMTEKSDRSGCTAICVVITPSHIICSNAGDSRSCYLTSSTVVALSDDHKPYNPGEMARIEAGGGYVSMKRVDGDLAVSRALGDFQYKDKEGLPPQKQRVTADPDVTTYERKRGKDEFVVIACDGIWDVATNEECLDMVQGILDEGETNPQLAAEEILDLCLEKGSRDNMTAAVIWFEEGVKIKEGEGGKGVMGRREKREKERIEREEEEAKARGETGQGE